MNINGESQSIITNKIISNDGSADISLNDDVINLEADSVLVNGQAIGVAQGFVTNPLSSNLNCNNKNLFNAGTYNGFNLATISSDIETLENKTFHIDPILSIDSTNFLANVKAPKFITSDTQPPRYLMSDGTELSNSGNNAGSNIFLYNNNLNITAPPSAGQIRFNNAVIADTTTIYISHLTRDGTDIDPFLALITQLSILYIQDQDNSLNFCKFNVITTPTITPNSFVTVNVTYIDGGGTGTTNFPAGMNIFLSIFTNDIEIDTRLSNVETKTQNITATPTENTIAKTLNLRLGVFDLLYLTNSTGTQARFSVSNTNAISYVTMSMNNNILNGITTPIYNDDAVNKLYVDTAPYVKTGTLTASSVPYFTATNTRSGSTRNLFVELGVNTIQSGIDAITLGGAVGKSVTVSSGSSTENIICVRQNYTLCGAICPPFTQTTQITGNLTIGSASYLSTRVRVSHMKFEGNLIFDNSTNQQLRTYFYNCNWDGTVTFPTSAATGTNGTQIFFDSCSFSGASAIVIPNQSLYTIFFTRCAFIGQTITNNQVVGNTTKLIFTDCSYLPTLSTLGFCILNGLNTTLTTTQANFGSIVLGGTTSQLLLGNGGNIPITTYPTMTTGSFTLQWTGGAGGTTSDQTVNWRRISDGTSTTVWLRLAPFTVTIGTANSNFGVLCTNPTVPANLSVAGQPFLPVIATFAGVIQCGWMTHYGTTLGIQPGNRGAALAGTVCGLSNLSIVSYMI